MASEYITTRTLKELSHAGSLRSVLLVSTGSRFALRAKIGMIERVLRPTNGAAKARLWSSLDSAARFVREDLQIGNFEVDLSNWDPKQRGFQDW